MKLQPSGRSDLGDICIAECLAACGVGKQASCLAHENANLSATNALQPSIAEPVLSAQGIQPSSTHHPTAPGRNVPNQQLHKRTVHRLKIIRGYLLGMPPEIQHVCATSC